MRKYAARVDGNQADIVEALRGIGAFVVVTSAVGKGFPDLLCIFRGVTRMLELKDPTKPKSDQKLTPDQVKFHANCMARGVMVHVVYSAEGAVALLA